MRIGLAHTGTGPFVQEVARALDGDGLLAWYATSFVDAPESLWRRALVRAARALGIDLDRELRRRSVHGVARERIRTYPAREAVRSIVARIDTDGRLADRVFDWANRGFDEWVARGLKDIDAVYGYEYACRATFEAAAAQGIRRIYEVPSPEHEYVERLLAREYDRFREFRSPLRRYLDARRPQRTERRRTEWRLADVVIVNSELTKQSYEEAGLPVAKVRVVPLGAPPVEPRGIDGGSPREAPMRFLWAGTFSVRKGAHHLLRAWTDAGLGTKAELNVYGARELPGALGIDSPNIRFRRTVPHDALFEVYRQGDVLVFPSLCDGFGMVVTEALSQGLPVITTNRVGAAHFVENGVNGLVVGAGDPDALAGALRWCVEHREQLRAMRLPALQAAQRWQWGDFRRSLVANVLDGLAQASNREWSGAESVS